MPFKKGETGNPKGRPPAMATSAEMIRVKLGEHYESVLQAVINAAVNGDIQAAKLVMDRICPPLKPRDGVSVFALPTNGELYEQGSAVLEALSVGKLTPLESSTILTALAGQGRLVELYDLTKRVEALEGAGAA